MRKLVSLTCIIVISFIFINGCASVEKKASKLIADKGYKVISSLGKIDEYTLEKDKLLGLPYKDIWGVQKIEASDYINKKIETYKFVVKNHPLDNVKDNEKNQTIVFIMICDKKAIGGYSLPDYSEIHVGSVYSLDGKTLEKVTGMSFGEWDREWTKKYK